MNDLLLAALACAAVPTIGAAQDPVPERDWPGLEGVRAVLSSPEGKDAAARLAELGPSAAPTLWAILSGQVPDGHDHARSELEALFRSAMTLWPTREVVARLVAAADERTPLLERLALVELLGWVDSDDTLEAVFEVLEGLDPVQVRSHAVPASLGRALEPLLLADPTRFRDLAYLLSEIPADLYPAIARAVDLPRPESIGVLAQIAFVSPEHELLVLQEIAQRRGGVTQGAHEDCVDLARRFLDSRDPRQRRLAASAVGRLRDAGSFHDLVEMLADEDAVVRRVALGALQELTGIRRTWSAAQWRRWEANEVDWLAGAQELAEDAASRDAHLAGKAIRELAHHRLFAEEVVELLARGLEARHALARVRTCQALALLDHGAAVPDLIHALEDPEGEVRAAARGALRRQTGLDLGPLPGDWAEWWESL